MHALIIALGYMGFFAPTALGAIGSSVGCTLAGQTALGGMIDLESGYGKYLGLVALPSSQTIYGIVVTFQLNHPITQVNAPGYAAIGLLTGFTFMLCGMRQGRYCSSAIRVWKNKPEVLSYTFAPAAIVEGFAVFTFVFGLLAASHIPIPKG